MKKMIAWILALSLILCAAVVPAMADQRGTQTDTVTSATTNQNGKDNRRNDQGGQPQNGQMPGNQNGQMPGNQMPGNQMPGNQNGQMPGNQMPGNQNGQMPGNQMHGGKHQQPGMTQTIPGSTEGTTGEAGTQPQAPGNSQPVRNGKAGKDSGVRDAIYTLLLEKGVITQEVYDAIMNYINGTTGQEAAEENSRTEENTDSAAAPAAGKPMDNRGRGGRKGNGAHGVSFEELLAKGVITQEVYDAIMNFIKEYTGQEATDATAPEMPEAPEGFGAPEGPGMPEPPEVPEAPEAAEDTAET